jgi:hypothetical protein
MSKEDDLLRKVAIKDGERILGLLHEPDKEKILAWRAATTEPKKDTVMSKDDAEARNIILTIFVILFIITNFIFVVSRPEGWPLNCSVEHKERIVWSLLCEDGFICDESNKNAYYIANVGDWKCKTNDKRHFSCDSVEKLPNEF